MHLRLFNHSSTPEESDNHVLWGFLFPLFPVRATPPPFGWQKARSNLKAFKSIDVRRHNAVRADREWPVSVCSLEGDIGNGQSSEMATKDENRAYCREPTVCVMHFLKPEPSRCVVNTDVASCRASPTRLTPLGLAKLTSRLSKHFWGCALWLHFDSLMAGVGHGRRFNIVIILLWFVPYRGTVTAFWRNVGFVLGMGRLKFWCIHGLSKRCPLQVK